MLALEQATVRIGTKTLLHNTSLRLSPGEVLAVVGPNGAGKSTLLRLLSGEWTPSSGRVSWGGQALTGFAPDVQARRRAVMPQHSTLTFAFPVLDVVLMGRTPHGTSRSQDLDLAHRAMTAAGVAHLAARRYPTLSGGEQQRVHLARALAQIGDAPNGASRYLLLDEPTASLDLAHQHQVLRTARQCAAQGVGVLTVLHDLNLASQYADRIAVFSKGRLLAEGHPVQVLTPEVILEAFDIPVLVTPHPCAACPLVVPAPLTETAFFETQDFAS